MKFQIIESFYNRFYIGSSKLYELMRVCELLESGLTKVDSIPLVFFVVYWTRNVHKFLFILWNVGFEMDFSSNALERWFGR